jgi:hypothetical protein
LWDYDAKKKKFKNSSEDYDDYLQKKKKSLAETKMS